MSEQNNTEKKTPFYKKKWFIGIIAIIFFIAIIDNSKEDELKREVELLEDNILALENEVEDLSKELDDKEEELSKLKDENSDKNIKPEELESKDSKDEMDLEEDNKPDIESIIKSRKEKYDDLNIDRITINEDLGTEDIDDDYIVLVYTTWTKSNKPDTANKMLRMYSNDMAASIANDGIDNVNNFVVFIKDEYNNRDVKYQYIYKDNNFFLEDKAE